MSSNWEGLISLDRMREAQRDLGIEDILYLLYLTKFDNSISWGFAISQSMS